MVNCDFKKEFVNFFFNIRRMLSTVLNICMKYPTAKYLYR